MDVLAGGRGGPREDVRSWPAAVRLGHVLTVQGLRSRPPRWPRTPCPSLSWRVRMAIAAEPVVTRTATPVPPRGSALLRLFRTTDHKQIGVMYLVTTFGFFIVGGVMALLMRAEVGLPGLQFLSPEQYNQLFTMHG